MLVTLFGIAVVTFAVTRLTPGDPTGVAEAAIEGVAFDDLVEQNRRNLGLDKPMLLNFRFEDRTTAAEDALTDFIRPVGFWQEDARRRLRLSSTIAIEPALDMVERLLASDESVDHRFEPTDDPRQRVNRARAVERIFDLLPSMASAGPEGLEEGMAPEEALAVWRAWLEANRERWTERAVREASARYLAGESETEDILIRGGYAIPYMMRGLESRDSDEARRANRALSGLTGFTFLRSDANWEEERAEVTRRWRSFYARERIRYSEFGAFGHSWNIISNTQFGVWMRQIVRLDFGHSYAYRRSVNSLILERLPITIVLSFLSIFFAYLLAIPIGVLSSIRQHTRSDQFITVMLFILYSLPTFWTGLILLLTLTGGPSPIPGLNWPELFPTRGVNSEGLDWTTGQPRAIADMLWHIALPVFCLTYGSLAFLSRQMRAAMLETLDQDYLRTAVAKGLNERTIVLKHAFRNSLIPIITLSAGLLPELIAGSIVIESIFNIQGMGLLSFEAILNRDYPVINAILFFSALLTLIGILLADLAYAVVDPRISYE